MWSPYCKVKYHYPDTQLLEIKVAQGLKEIHSLKISMIEVQKELAKQKQIENKLQKGENLADNNGGWFDLWFN